MAMSNVLRKTVLGGVLGFGVMAGIVALVYLLYNRVFDHGIQLPSLNMEFPCGEVRDMQFSPDDMTLGVARGNGLIELWDVEKNNKQVLLPPMVGVPVNHISFSPNGNLLAAAYNNGLITLWNLATGKVDRHFQIDTHKYAYSHLLTFVADGQSLIIGCDKKNARDWEMAVVRWNLTTNTNEIIKEFDVDFKLLALSPNGRYIVIHKDAGGFGKEPIANIKVYDLETKQEVLTLSNPCQTALTTAVFSPDSRIVGASGPGPDLGNACLWEIPSGKIITTLKPPSRGYASILSLSPNGKLLAVSGWGNTHLVGILDAETGMLKGRFASYDTNVLCKIIRFSPDGQTLAVCNSGSNKADENVPVVIKLWKLPTEWLPPSSKTEKRNGGNGRK
jgi:WD40 repeat protein